jgi:hypothetical protein
MLLKVKVLVLLLASVAGNVGLCAADYIPPMKIPISLSANFGELRPNHFHSGLDFRTQKREGIPVYAVAGGYVSRIGVLTWGYGNALYIAHKDGTTSVYGHLQKFVPNIAAWVKEQQYKNQSFVIDTYLTPSKFPVKQGDLIGYSGNSGGSTGPHLHFELRDAAQVPFNPLSRNIYKVADHLAPQASHLYVYQLNYVENTLIRSLRQTYPIALTAKSGNTLKIMSGDTIEVSSNAIFGLDMLDRKDGSQSTFGVYSAQVWFDGVMYFEWNLDHFSFAETRYANASIDFDHYNRTRRYVTMLYRAPNNALRIYTRGTSNGVLDLPVGGKTKVEIRLMDDAGNVSKVVFWAKNKGTPTFIDVLTDSKILYSHKANHFATDNFKLMIPPLCLYESCLLRVKQSYTFTENALTPLYSLSCQPTIPPHTNMTVCIKADIPRPLWDKVAMVNRNGRGKKTLRDGNFFVASTREWGNFMLAIDTVPPHIEYIFPKSDKVKKSHFVRFRVTDNMTSIKRYSGYIDGEWALFEMNGNVAIYRIDYTRVRRNTSHIVQFIAEDEMGNAAEKAYEIFF